MKNDDPVLALIAAAVITLEAAWILLRALLVPVVALVLVLAQWRPAAAPAPAAAEPEPMVARPTPHPLALIAAELEALPAATLRQMAGIRSRRHSKAALVGMVIACS